MALQDPVAVFDADTNLEAQLVRTLLVDAGIEAFAIDDVSFVGTCTLGTLSGINKPQVFVERVDVERALDFLDTYEDRIREQRPVPTNDQFCHHCGESLEPGATTCAACGQPIDAPDDAEADDVNARSVVTDQEHTSGIVADVLPGGALSGFRAFKKPLAWLFLICVVGPPLLLAIAATAEAVCRMMGWFR